MIKDWYKLYKRSGIPETHWRASLDKIPNYAYKRDVENYVKNIERYLKEGKGLLLYGPPSSGKSAAASIACKMAINCLKIPYWVRNLDLIDAKMENKYFDADTTVYERCIEVPLLVIDELIARKDSAYMERLTEEVIRTRVDKKRSTIITCNYSKEYLEEHLTTLAAVLNEAVFYVHVKGHDFRKNEKYVPKETKESDGTTNLWKR